MTKQPARPEQAEAETYQAQKLTAIGQLAAGVAHGINTPMQYVNDNTHFVQRCAAKLVPLVVLAQRMRDTLLAEGVDNDLVQEFTRIEKLSKLDYLLSEMPKALDDSLEGIRRVTSIVTALKQFSYPSDGRKQSVDLRQVIETTTTVSRNAWKYIADMRFDFAAALGDVPALKDELNQVILNLIINAADAINERRQREPALRGTITFTTLRDGDFAVIKVSDNGDGIPAEVRARIFDPFFTTKPVGKGTGQGLAIAYSVIVDKHDGSIGVDSEVGVGTTFTLRIPLGRAP